MTKQTDLISDKYLDGQKWMHAQPRGYGGKGDKWAATVRDLALGYNVSSVLDYGCGQGSLKRTFEKNGLVLPFLEYDPAIPGKDALPEPADLVVCTDVLEHIEPAKIDAVLDHLCGLARKVLFVVIATTEAQKKLKDGRNAHILICSSAWWIAALGKRMDRAEVVPCRDWKEYAAVYVPRSK